MRVRVRVCVCVCVCARVCVCACACDPRSGVDVEGQQFVGVQVVEGAQVGQAQQQLGEEAAVPGVSAGGEGPQGADQTLLELLHRAGVRDA